MPFETARPSRDSVAIWAMFLSLLLLAASGSARAAEPVFSVHAVKAAYLHRFASYVEWPDGVADGRSFIIAVAGDDEVASQLARLLPGMSVRGRPAVVRKVSRPQELEGVSILYVGPGALPRTRSLRAAAAQLPILIVTDDEQGFDAGGVINFVEINRNVRFEISLRAADRSHLRIDSALLSVAARVERRPQTCINCLEPGTQRLASVDTGTVL